jgi:hypothetical protein
MEWWWRHELAVIQRPVIQYAFVQHTVIQYTIIQYAFVQHSFIQHPPYGWQLSRELAELQLGVQRGRLQWRL